MQNTYYKHPNISLNREHVEKATGLTSYHYREFDNFKSKMVMMSETDTTHLPVV